MRPKRPQAPCPARGLPFRAAPQARSGPGRPSPQGRAHDAARPGPGQPIRPWGGTPRAPHPRGTPPVPQRAPRARGERRCTFTSCGRRPPRLLPLRSAVRHFPPPPPPAQRMRAAMPRLRRLPLLPRPWRRHSGRTGSGSRAGRAERSPSGARVVHFRQAGARAGAS